MDEKFINGLKIAFASQYAFAIKAQNFHWNVEGQDFYQLHQLFEDIYNETYGAVDAFAENIRKIKAYTAP
jgi:starvation-inducible DNA-binding protein